MHGEGTALKPCVQDVDNGVVLETCFQLLFHYGRAKAILIRVLEPWSKTSVKVYLKSVNV